MKKVGRARTKKRNKAGSKLSIEGCESARDEFSTRPFCCDFSILFVPVWL